MAKPWSEMTTRERNLAQNQHRVGLPLGARLLGCRGCLPRNRGLYCASCPITLRRIAKSS